MKGFSDKAWREMSNGEQREWLRLKKIGGLKGRILRHFFMAMNEDYCLQDLSCLETVSNLIENYPDGKDYKNRSFEMDAICYFEEYLNNTSLFVAQDSAQLVAYVGKVIKEYKESRK